MARTAHLPVAAADGLVALKAGRSASEEVTLTGQLGAVQWNDNNGTEIRLYGPDQQDPMSTKVPEFSWQRSDPWVQGLTPAVCSATSRVAAVHWHKDDATHLRLYSQDTGNRIVEWSYDTPSWSKGLTVSGAYPGTGIAALAVFNPKKDSVHLFLYYQAANNQIIELYWDGDTRSGWVPSHAFQGAAAGTGIAAVYFLDEGNKPHKRLYYQDTSGLVIEQCWDDGGEWALGHTFSVVPIGSAIAATHWWRDGSHVRLYFQNTQDDIAEWCYETGSSWFAGHTFTQVAPGTGIAAVGWDGASNHVRVYYKDAAPYEGSYHAVIEQCYDGGEWHPGTFIARAS